MADGSTATCIDILLAIILPPLGVFLKFGCQAELQASLEASKKADNVVSFSVSSSSGTVSLPVSVLPSFVSSLPSAVVCSDMASSSCVTSVAACICALKSVPSNLPCVSVDFADVRARVLSTQSILTSLKSTVVRMERVLLDDKKLLQSLEAGDVGSDSAPAR
nr:hydrophobic protein RCI2B [Ipomoea batatas]